MSYFLVLLKWTATSDSAPAGACIQVCPCCSKEGRAGHLSLALIDYNGNRDELSEQVAAQLTNGLSIDSIIFGRMQIGNRLEAGRRHQPLLDAGFRDIRYVSFWCEPEVTLECLCTTLFCFCCKEYKSGVKTVYSADHKEEKMYPDLKVIEINLDSYERVKEHINGNIYAPESPLKWSVRHNCSTVALYCINSARLINGRPVYQTSGVDCNQCCFSTPEGIFSRCQGGIMLSSVELNERRRGVTRILFGAAAT